MRKFKVLQSCPVQLKGRCRQACRVALEALHVAVMEHDGTRELRAWKLFSVLPFWLLLRPGSQGRVGRDELLRSIQSVRRRSLGQTPCRSNPSPPTSAQPANFDPRAEGQGSLPESPSGGEVSRARQCLTGAPLAPGTQETLQELQHRRPQVQQRAVPEEILEHEPQPVSLDRSKFLASLRSAPRGSSRGPGGCTYEHLKILLDDTDTTELLMSACERLAQGKIPVDVRNAVMGARLTALSKPLGGVRGIATGSTIRRLVARTLAKQFMEEFEAECAPFQYALSSRGWH